jgi:hypothetical protein
MSYSVCAFREYIAVTGLIEEEPVAPEDFRTANAAEDRAKELAATGKYSSIVIQHSSGGYYNPRVGIEPVGRNWVDEVQ